MAEERRAPRRQLHAQDAGSLNAALVLMENALDKLRVMGYEQRFCQEKGEHPFTRVEFSMPGQNPAVQSKLFFKLCEWLVSVATNGAEELQLDELDTPSIKASKLMVALRNMEFSAELSASRLTTPHGEEVCRVLDFLTDCALAAAKFSWQPPVYEDDDDVEEADVDEEAAIDDIEDEIEDMVDEETMFEAPVDAAEVSMDRSHHAILKSEVDPVAWKTELERVGPRLRSKHVGAGNEWRAHIEQTKKHEETIRQRWPSTETELSALSRDVADAVSRLSGKEKNINNQFETFRKEYEEFRRKLETVRSQFETMNESVQNKANELESCNEQLSEMKERTENRDPASSATSPLIRIKNALQDIRKQTRVTELRIGVVSHTLLAARMRDNKLHRNNQKKSRQSRRHAQDRDEHKTSLLQHESSNYDFDDLDM